MTDWQTIDTAPRDGRLIIAWNKHVDTMCAVGWKPADGDEEAHWDDKGSRNAAPALYFNANYFQYWMPRPAVPRIPKRSSFKK